MRRGLPLAVCLSILLLRGASGEEAKPAVIAVDKEKKTVTVPAKIALRKLPKLDQVYPIEVVATWPHPTGQKAHETVITYEGKPSEIHKAVESLGLKAGKPAKGEGAESAGPEVKLSLEVPVAGGGTKKVPIEKTLIDKRTGKTMPTVIWRFTGSTMKKLDPNKPDETYAADTTGTLIAIFPVTDETVFQSNLTMKDEPVLKMDTNTKLLPAEGTEVKLVIEVP